MAFLSQRSAESELMDAPEASEQELVKVLEELETVNKWLGGYAPLYDAYKRIGLHRHPLTIMDLGSGGGDVLRKTAEWLHKHGLKNYRLIGVDNHPIMTEYASSQSDEWQNMEFVTYDAFDERLKEYQPDIVLNNLFCHHFTDASLPQLLLWMKDLAGKAVIINDLHRHWFAYYSIMILTKLISGSRFVKYDAPLSVARSLTREEWRHTLQEANIENYSLRWMWAWRWQVIINAY
jgi:2-polyprenyl-3-methyl-5-hydroxy-6-metoxy-1,4-benzoquinol methylase